jgi:hypothetical protein
VVEAIPPSVFFADREASKQRLMVPFTFAPEYSRRVWAFVAETIVAGTLRRALSGKFQQDIAAHLSSACGTLPDDLEVTLHPSDGRIMLRRPGYDLKPHRDPKWGFVTGLVYLAREGDVETHGTRLYRVRDDADAPDGNVFYIAPERCQLVKTVPFRANTLLAFVNSSGAHSASIPADAPRDLERYLYQFRLGPTSAVIKRLLQLMPPEKASMWAGGKTARAAN